MLHRVVVRFPRIPGSLYPIQEAVRKATLFLGEKDLLTIVMWFLKAQKIYSYLCSVGKEYPLMHRQSTLRYIRGQHRGLLYWGHHRISESSYQD